MTKAYGISSTSRRQTSLSVRSDPAYSATLNPVPPVQKPAAAWSSDSCRSDELTFSFLPSHVPVHRVRAVGVSTNYKSPSHTNGKAGRAFF
jgi:hypothetical protein